MSTRRIKRSAVPGNMVTVDSASFITLVKKPANQRGFSILRSETEDDTVSKANDTKRVPRTRRSDSNQDLVSLTLPGTLDEAGAKAALVTYGLNTFTVARSEDDSCWVAQNPGAINCTDTAEVKLGDGIVATVKRTEATNATEGKTQLTLTSLTFDAEKFADSAAISEWCQRNSVDFDDKALNNPSGTFVLQRAEVTDGEETRLMELEDGVTATIIRSQIGDIPDGFIAVINEYAYLGWGWGQLDFTASLVGGQVTDSLYEGIYVLEDLLRNILFWSELTVDIRKELVTRACTQFAAFANGLLDTLPRQLLISVATTQRSSKENDMSTTAAPAPIKRTEAEAVVAPAVGTPEFDAAVATAVSAALVKRDEEAATAEAARVQREADEATAATAATEAAKVQRTELAAAIAEAQKPLLDEIASLKGTTIVRSDAGDGKQAVPAKRGDDVFVGIFGNIKRSAPVAAAPAAPEAPATE